MVFDRADGSACRPPPAKYACTYLLPATPVGKLRMASPDPFTVPVPRMVLVFKSMNVTVGPGGTAPAWLLAACAVSVIGVPGLCGLPGLWLRTTLVVATVEKAVPRWPI